MAKDAQTQRIMRVFGIDVAAPGTATVPPNAATADTATGDTLFLDERLAGIIADVKLYAAAQLSGLVREAAIAIKPGRPDAATPVEGLEDQLVEIGAAFHRAEAQREVAKGGMGKASVVAFAKTRLRWESAQRAVADATANVGDGFRALLETDEFQDDPHVRNRHAWADRCTGGAAAPDRDAGGRGRRCARHDGIDARGGAAPHRRCAEGVRHL